MQPTAINALAAALILSASYAAPTPDANKARDNTDLLGQLITTPTQIQRFHKLLTDASGTKLLEGDDLIKATVWDFKQNGFSPPGGQGGSISGAEPLTFPFLFGAGLNINLGTIGPCGILLPHVHPRASEFFITLSNNTITVGTALERGLLPGGQSPEIISHLPQYSGTLFPQGAVHWQINDSEDCKDATAVVVLTSDDPGTTTVLHEAEGNGTVLGRREVGRSDFENVRKVTPPHLARIVDRCFERCHIA